MLAYWVRRPERTKIVLIYDFYINIRAKLSLIRCYTIFPLWLRTGSNPADINRFRIHTGKAFYYELIKNWPSVTPWFFLSNCLNLFILGWLWCSCLGSNHYPPSPSFTLIHPCHSWNHNYLAPLLTIRSSRYCSQV